jgi:hypothetical protein
MTTARVIPDRPPPDVIRGISPGHPRLPEPQRRNDGGPQNKPRDDREMSGQVTCAVVPGRVSARTRPEGPRVWKPGTTTLPIRTQRPPRCPLLCRQRFQVPLRGPGTTGGGGVITPGWSERKPLQGRGSIVPGLRVDPLR